MIRATRSRLQSSQGAAHRDFRSRRGGYLKNRYVTFSAMSLSPMSNVGYIDKEGMKRGSAMNLGAEK